MILSRKIAVTLAAALAPAWAAMYRGSVAESRFGVGVDSIKVTLKSTSEITFTDSSGRFTFLNTGINGATRLKP